MQKLSYTERKEALTSVCRSFSLAAVKFILYLKKPSAFMINKQQENIFSFRHIKKKRKLDLTGLFLTQTYSCTQHCQDDHKTQYVCAWFAVMQNMQFFYHLAHFLSQSGYECVISHGITLPVICKPFSICASLVSDKCHVNVYNLCKIVFFFLPRLHCKQCSCSAY